MSDLNPLLCCTTVAAEYGARILGEAAAQLAGTPAVWTCLRVLLPVTNAIVCFCGAAISQRPDCQFCDKGGLYIRAIPSQPSGGRKQSRQRVARGRVPLQTIDSVAPLPWHSPAPLCNCKRRRKRKRTSALKPIRRCPQHCGRHWVHYQCQLDATEPPAASPAPSETTLQYKPSRAA